MEKEIRKGYRRRRLESVIHVTNTRYYTKTIKSASMFLLVTVMVLKLSVLVEVVFILQKTLNDDYRSKPKYKILPELLNLQYDYNKHLHTVLERVGYEQDSRTGLWDLLWSYDDVRYRTFKELLPHQKVNHIPGTSHMTNKKKLALLTSKYIPKSFVLPKQKAEFLKYVEHNKKLLFLQKKTTHRGIRMINMSDVNKLCEQTFIQEYVQDPLLVNGHKFDIGVYVVITSMSPLRAYWYKGDVLFRYCPVQYYPFDYTDVRKYVVGDDYMPTWEVPYQAEPYSSLGLGMKNIFDTYVKSKGIKPWKLWLKIQEVIAEILFLNQSFMQKAAKQFSSQDNFFQLLRFDFIINESLDVYLLEINRSPILSSAKFPENSLLFEQLLYNLFLLTGVAHKTREVSDMVSSQRDIVVFGENCLQLCIGNCKASIICKLCKHCLTEKLKKSLLNAHAEFVHRGDFRLIFPPLDFSINLKQLSSLNRLQYLWYKEKCTHDITWCT